MMDVLNLDDEFKPFKDTILYDSFIFSGVRFTLN